MGLVFGLNMRQGSKQGIFFKLTFQLLKFEAHL